MLSRSVNMLSRFASPISRRGTHVLRRISKASAPIVRPTVGICFEKISNQSIRSQSTAEKSGAEEVAKPFVPSPDRKYQNFQNVKITDSGVAVIKIDCLGKPVNTISFAFADESKTLWENEIAKNPAVKSVVFMSAKPNMFIAGADIFDIQTLENKQDLIPLIAQGIESFTSWKNSGLKIVAAIDGPALGGGLEWALWCDYRICTDNPKTKMGLPEVKLGLLPGFGGTQRLHEVVGLQKAMDMMLTGKDIRPKQAKKMGLVDLVVSSSSLERVAIESAEQLAAGKLKPKKKTKSYMDWALEDTPIGRNLVWNQIDKMVQKQTNGNYPSPLAIIQCVKYGLENPGERYKNEREQFAKLAETNESESLIGIFDGMNKLKKQTDGMPKAENLSTVAVLGAGLMGSGIAQVSVEKAGYRVLLKDRDDAGVSRGMKNMTDSWDKKLKKKRMTEYKRNKMVSEVIPLTDDSASWKQHFGKADLVVEAVFEDLNLKKQIVADMEEIIPNDAVFATNTSAIPIGSIAADAKRPENIIGMHYFSPVPMMPLLEIIPHEGTSDATISKAFTVGQAQGKTCILAKDVPGFYVNRCLGPYLIEVSAVMMDGAALESIDRAMVNFGMPVGPISLGDEVGIDVASHVATFLSKADLGVRMEGGDVTMMQKMAADGLLGKKAGKGFYDYSDKKSKTKKVTAQVAEKLKQFQKPGNTVEDIEIQNRLVTR